MLPRVTVPTLRRWPVTRRATRRYNALAGQFVNANSEYLSVANNAGLQTGDIDFTVSVWTYLDSTTNSSWAISKSEEPTGDEYGVFYRSPTNRFSFYSASDVDASFNDANTFGAPSLSTWYHVVAWYTAADNTMHITVNNGVEDSSVATSAITAKAVPLLIGGYRDFATAARRSDGRISSVGFWKRVLLPGEREALYNEGTGLSYNQLPATLKTSLISYWNLDEASGTRNDSHGANHLTDNNTVTQAFGPR